MKKYDKKVMISTTFITIILLNICWAALTWIIVCGLIKLITLCFGLTFSWLIASGVWLVLFILRFMFK